MNSEKLKKKYESIYQDFFSNSEFVLSLPLTVEWSGTACLAGSYSGIYLKQKTPLRTYIGVSLHDAKGVFFDQIRCYNFEECNFDVIDCSNKGSSSDPYFFKLSTHISSLLPDNNGGIRLSILSEAPTKMGLACFPNISFGSILASQCFIGKLNALDMINQSKDNIDDVYYTTFVGELIRSACLFSEKMSGYTTYLSNITSFFCGSSQFGSYRDPVPHGTTEKKLNFAGIKTNELSLAHNGHLDIVNCNANFDSAFVYTGFPLQPNKHSLSNNYMERITGMKQVIEEMFASYKDKINTSQSLFDGFGNKEIPNMDEIFTRVQEAINIEIWHALLSLTHNKFDGHALNNLIAAINKIIPLFAISHSYGKNFLNTLDYIANFFRSYNASVGMLPFDIMRDGGVVSIISPLESNRKKVHQMVEEYRRIHPDSQMSVIYESRKDGYEYEGVKVEQDIRSGIFSDFIERGNCMIQHYDGSTQLIEHSQIALQTYDDIIVDTIHHKIYLPGHKLTSKDLHTQTSTSEILEIALQNLDTDIPNTKLPVGAYAKNKNDMTAKIIIPLKKLIDKYCNKDLMFTCSGSLTSFSIRLSPGKVKFGIVKPLP